MTSMRGIGQRQGGGGQQPAAGGTGGQRSVDVRQLDAESQRAHELLKGLSDGGDGAGRRKILAAAGVGEPLTPRTLTAVANHLARLDMPLTPKGIARFKADRALVGGSSLSGAVAAAYARAVDGGEVLFRVDRVEEQALRPSDRAVLNFLRQLARTAGAEAVGRLKEALALGNPPAASPQAAALMNEYIGVATVREVGRLTTLHSVALTSEAVRDFVVRLEAQTTGDTGAPTPARQVSATASTASTTTQATASASASASTSALSSASTSASTSGRTAPMVPGRGLRKP